MPVFALIYVAQYFLLMSFLPAGTIGNLMLLTGLILAGSLVFLLHYDAQHKVNIYEDYIVTNFFPFHSAQVYEISQLQDMVVTDEKYFSTDEEKESLAFSTLSLYFENGEQLSLYFIDQPFTVKSLLQKYQKQQKLKKQKDQEQKEQHQHHQEAA